MTTGRFVVRYGAFRMLAFVAVLLMLVEGGQADAAALDSPQLLSQKLDAAIHAEIEKSGSGIAPRIDDTTFLRRVYLDLAGRIPPTSVVDKYLSATVPLDRAALVDELLKSPEFANHWGRLWAQYLTDRRPFEQEGFNGRILQKYLRAAFAKNQPYDVLVRELLQGAGPSDESGPANFLLRYNAEPVPLTGAVSQKFLGLSLQCAECHDHPHATWSQDDFWGMAAYFSRLKRMSPADGSEQFVIIFERQHGELERPDKTAKPNDEGQYPNKIVFPRLLHDNKPEIREQRREAFLEWLLSPSNSYFARHGVDRVWAELFGQALVGSLDHANDQPPPELAVLDLLAEDFVRHKYDLSRLVKVIVLSETYQRGSQTGETKDGVAANSHRWARRQPRPFSADQLHLSLSQGTGAVGDGDDARLASLTQEEYTYDLPVDQFTEPPATTRRALALLNSDRINNAVNLAAEAAVRVHGPSPGVKHVQWLFLTLLSRRPSAEELDEMLELCGQQPGTEGLRDVVWVLLNSAEFNTSY